MDRKKTLATALFSVLFISVAIFFVFPKYQFVSKLLYLAIIAGYGTWHFLNRNIKATAICACGAAVLLLTLPNSQVFRDIELILIILGFGAVSFLLRRAKRRASQE